ncbi:MAG: tRNA (N6-isopentenyl adenosine(37)-C2)-methylthiotransferase MiaB [Patescibacteria group bacterium]
MKYNIITIGCQMNKADSERLAAYLEKKKYQAVADFKLADIVIINTCGVRQSAEDRAYGLVNQIKRFNPSAQIAITGCLSKRADVKKRLQAKVDLFFPINETPHLLSLLKNSERLLKLDDLRELSGEKYLAILPKHASYFKAFVPIGNGCNNFCSYCVVPYARGREVYRGAADIIKEVKALVRKGYKEITLIAQNVNSYHSLRAKKKFDFADLLRSLADIPGDFWLRFSSSHPKDLSGKLIRVMSQSDKICHHLHLAVQSGDDRILKAMNRKYSAKQYVDLVAKIRQAKPGIAISTDVIVGFPGETKAQFNNSLKLFKQLNFDQAFIARYSPRFGTAAAKLKDNVSLEEKKKREEILEKVLKKSALENNKKLLGKEIVILVESQNRKGKYFGLSSSSKTVSLVDKKVKIGEFVKAKITGVRDFGLTGEVVK